MIKSNPNVSEKSDGTDLNMSLHSSESDDLDNFRLRIDNSDADDASVKDDDLKSLAKEDALVKEDMEVDMAENKETEGGDQAAFDETSQNGLDKDQVKISDLVNGICEQLDGNDTSNETSSEANSKPDLKNPNEKASSDKDELQAESADELGDVKQSSEAKDSISKENDKDVPLDAKVSSEDDKSKEAVPENDEKSDNKATKKTVSLKDNSESPASPSHSNSKPSSLARSLSAESDISCESFTFEQTDEDNSNPPNFAGDLSKFGSRGKKRPLENEGVTESTETGAKKIRVEKRHCSDGEQDTEKTVGTAPKKNERRKSYSECDLIKDMENFNSLKQQCSTGLKNETWKQPELTAEEKKQLEQANVREKKIRENCLRLIQRNYTNMSVEDLEDSLYVAIMDYFCHYNPSGLLQRKVAMLEKLLSRVQENYNRTFKQFCEAKYLLRRMVEIRKEESKKCVCKDKLPFKMIRSVAVQVQTARCRGGELCPGSGVGLNPNFKAASSSPSKSVPSRKQQSDNQTSANSESVSSNSASNTQSQERPRHITVSVPPTAPVRSALTLRARPSSELQNGRTLPSKSIRQTAATTMTHTVSSPNTVKAQPDKTPKSTPSPAFSVVKTNNSIVIDLTDKDEDLVPPKTAPPPSQKSLQVTVQSPATRVVKTSVLSPMPQLPPLPPAPLYKSLVRRPPQPVLKVCKADQSGIMLSWTLRNFTTNEIMFYQVYACQENAGVTREWNTVGDVKALPLPMACTLSQFREGHRYHFVVRAVDKHKVLGEFSHPASILLVTKNGTTSSTPAITSPSTPR